jgi:ribosomal protein L37AE/L43A
MRLFLCGECAPKTVERETSGVTDCAACDRERACSWFELTDLLTRLRELEESDEYAKQTAWERSERD